MPRKFNALVSGDIVNDMKVISEFRDEKNNRRMLHCLCLKCGREHHVYEGNLRNYEGTSTHGIACSKGIASIDKPFADRFAHMKQRICNPDNSNYENYGGKGLTIDYEYLVDFYDDMYTRFLWAKQAYPDQRISIDRIDNNLGYIRGNLRWTIPTRQTRNSSKVYKFIGISPTGQYYLTNNQLAFAANHGLESKHISDCIRGLQETTGGGWRFFKPNQPSELFWFNYEQDPAIIKELYY